MYRFFIITLLFQIGWTVTINGRQSIYKHDCGKYVSNETASNIVGGRLTKPMEVPWQVLLFTQADEEHVVSALKCGIKNRRTS